MISFSNEKKIQIGFRKVSLEKEVHIILIESNFHEWIECSKCPKAACPQEVFLAPIESAPNVSIMNSVKAIGAGTKGKYATHQAIAATSVMTTR